MSFIYEKRKVVLNFKDKKPEVHKIAPRRQQKVPFEKLLNDASASCGVSCAITKASVEALLDRMCLFMDFGMPVSLGDFGTFKPTFNVKAQSSAEDLGTDNVTRKKILFIPGKRFKKMLENVTFQTFDTSSVSTGSNSSGGGNNGGGDDGGGDDGGSDDGGDDDGGGDWVDPNA